MKVLLPTHNKSGSLILSKEISMHFPAFKSLAVLISYVQISFPTRIVYFFGGGEEIGLAGFIIVRIGWGISPYKPALFNSHYKSKSIIRINLHKR